MSGPVFYIFMCDLTDINLDFYKTIRMAAQPERRWSSGHGRCFGNFRYVISLFKILCSDMMYLVHC